MDIMDRYKIRESISNAIQTLDSIPKSRDLIPEANIVKFIDPLSTSHLAIERGLKALIVDAGGPLKKTHNTIKLCRILAEYDRSEPDHLENSFHDAVRFFGYNVKRRGFGHFRSLEDYLSKTATKKSYDALRYWPIDDSNDAVSPIPYMSVPIHREILCALRLAFAGRRRETVSDRAERLIASAMFDGRRLAHNADDAIMKKAIHSYWNWLFKQNGTCMGALKQAVADEFNISTNEFIAKMLCDVFENLLQSTDPAVQYYTQTLKYLPAGSQERPRDAAPKVDWWNDEKTRGMVVSPGGTFLGIVEKWPDGSWSIEPTDERSFPVISNAVALKDAKYYLVNRLTKNATCLVNDDERELRICLANDFFVRSSVSGRVWTDSNDCPDSEIYELEVWDVTHGLQRDDRIALGVVWDVEKGWASVLEGTVIDVFDHKVTIAGSDLLTSSAHLEEWLQRSSGD